MRFIRTSLWVAITVFLSNLAWTDIVVEGDVTFDEPDFERFPVVFSLLDSSGQSISLFRTDEFGRYRIHIVSPGTYRLECTGFQFGEPVTITVFENDEIDAPLLVAQSYRRAAFRFAMHPGSSTERFAERGTVLLLDQNEDVLSASGIGLDGTVSFNDLQERPPYNIAYIFAGHYYSLSNPDLAITVGMETPPQNLPTIGLPNGKISGRVLHEGNIPLPDAKIQLLGLNLVYTYYTQSDANGRIALDGVEPGTYRMMIKPSLKSLAVFVMEGISVEQNGEVDLSDITIPLAGRISGKVIGADNSPMKNVQVSVSYPQASLALSPPTSGTGGE